MCIRDLATCEWSSHDLVKFNFPTHSQYTYKSLQQEVISQALERAKDVSQLELNRSIN